MHFSSCSFDIVWSGVPVLGTFRCSRLRPLCLMISIICKWEINNEEWDPRQQSPLCWRPWNVILATRARIVGAKNGLRRLLGLLPNGWVYFHLIAKPTMEVLGQHYNHLIRIGQMISIPKASLLSTHHRTVDHPIEERFVNLSSSVSLSPTQKKNGQCIDLSFL